MTKKSPVETLRLYISIILSRYPRFRRWLVMMVSKVWRLSWRIRSYLFKDRTIDWDRILIVDPNMIVRTVPIAINIWRDKGKVISGDWDLQKRGEEQGKIFEDTDVYQAFYQRMNNKKKWEETEYYFILLNRIEKGQAPWGCKSKGELDRRFQRLDLLYQNIRDIGYKTQRELTDNTLDLTEEDEITVSITRNGEFLFTNGGHRLSIVKILGINQVPVKVTVRHQEWVAFRRQILAYARGQNDRKVYAPLTHPDLNDIPSLYSDDRFDVIKRHISTNRGTLLDIGSHWGYFCHKFEDEGFDCYAVEDDPTNFYFLDRLKVAQKKRFKSFNGSIFEFREKNDFDIILALNIFHHFFKQKSLYLQFIELLKRLRAKELFVNTAGCNEPQMENAYKQYSEDGFINLILDCSNLNNATKIYDINGRSIYKVY